MDYGNLPLLFPLPLPHRPPPHRKHKPKQEERLSLSTSDSTLLSRENPFQPPHDLSSSLPPLVPLLVLPHSENLVRNRHRPFDLTPYPENFWSNLRPIHPLFRFRNCSDLYGSPRRILERRSRRFRSLVHDDSLFNVPL